MTLEQLRARSTELAVNINQATNQVFVIQGHKNEVDYQIKLAEELSKKEAEEDCGEVATADEYPVV